MATRCPNCDCSLGVRWTPSLAPTWNCGCGVEVTHTPSSFAELWLRSLLPISVIAGLGGGAFLKYGGHVPEASIAQLALLALVAAAGTFFGLAMVFGPLSYVVAFARGIAFTTGDAVKAAAVTLILLVGFPLLGWFTFDSVRGHLHLSGNGSPMVRSP